MSNTRSAPAIADSTVLNWFAKSDSGLVNCLAYSAKITITPTVTPADSFKANIPPIPATIAKLKLFK